MKNKPKENLVFVRDNLRLKLTNLQNSLQDTIRTYFKAAKDEEGTM